MSAITGKPTAADIQTYMTKLKNCGIEQITLYPRAGCELEYLSEEWFEVIGYFLKTAKERNMFIWLYDEFNWPSGDAGGRVTKIPEFRLKSITTKGENIGQIHTGSTNTGELFGQKFFPDLLSKQAVDYFIECTHEQYYKRFASYFGSTIKGFYTDEPAVGYCCTETSVPYYEGMEEDYYQLCKRSFSEDLISGTPAFYGVVMEMIAARFHKCFIHTIRTWCEKHHILMTGHLMEDHAPFHATRHSGNLLKNLSAFSLPGIDDIATSFLIAPAHFGAIEYASGTNGAMAELFALGPCDMTYAKKRCMLYYAACHKIDHYFLGTSHMDLRGNRLIKDFFNDFMSDQPDFEGISILAEEAKTAAAYAKKDFIPDVFVQYPTRLCAEHMNEAFDISAFSRLLDRLTYYQLQWKFITEDDNSGDIPVVKLNDKTEYCLDSLVTSDTEVLCKTLADKITVTAKNGTIPEGIFVRAFEDGSLIVINYLGEPNVYRIHGKEYFIDRHGVFISDRSQALSVLSEKKENICVPFELTYHNENIIRTMYLNEQTDAVLEVVQPVDIHIAVREDTQAQIDGIPIHTDTGAVPGDFPDGLKPLYQFSESRSFEPGIYTVTSADDIKFLPSVFVTGNFSAAVHSDKICSLTLCSRKNTYHIGEKFTDYGVIEFTASVKVPYGAAALRLVGTTLYTRLAFGSCLSEPKICSPYIFEVKKDLWNKEIDLKIIQYSSIAPIFGDTDYYNDVSTDVKWDNTPRRSGTFFGFDEIYWILKGDSDNAC